MSRLLALVYVIALVRLDFGERINPRLFASYAVWIRCVQMKASADDCQNHSRALHPRFLDRTLPHHFRYPQPPRQAS